LAFRKEGRLRPKTRWNLQKVLKFRDAKASVDMGKKAGDYVEHLIASPVAFKTLHEERLEATKKSTQKPLQPHIRRVGQTLPGQTRSALELSRGALGQPRESRDGPVLSLGTMFGRKYKNTDART